MATAEEIALQLKIQGEADAQSLTKALTDTKAQLVAVGQAMGGLTTPGARADATVQAMTAQVQRMTKELKAAEKAAGDMGSKLAGTGQSLLQIGRITQDFQAGGLNGVLNNIEGLVQALGGPAGLAGVLTVVGVAGYIAKPHIEKFIESLKGDDVTKFANQVEYLEDKLKKLTKEPIKVRVEALEVLRTEKQLKEAKQSVAAFEGFGDQQTEAQQTSGKAVQKAVVEGLHPKSPEAFAEQIQSKIIEKTLPSALSDTDRQIKIQKDILAKGPGPRNDRAPTKQSIEYAQAAPEIRRLEAEQEKIKTRVGIAGISQGESGLATGKLLHGAFSGNSDSIKELADYLKDLGHPNVGNAIKSFTPEEMAKQQKEKEEDKKTDEDYAKRRKDDEFAANAEKQLIAKEEQRWIEDTQRWNELWRLKKEAAAIEKQAAEQRAKAASSQADQYAKGFQDLFSSRLNVEQFKGIIQRKDSKAVDAELHEKVSNQLKSAGVPAELRDEVASKIVGNSRQDVSLQNARRQVGMAGGGFGGGGGGFGGDMGGGMGNLPPG
jgi:hypothetical protein